MVLAVTYPWASASSYLSSQSVADSRCNPHATPRSSYSRRTPELHLHEPCRGPEGASDVDDVGVRVFLVYCAPDSYTQRSRTWSSVLHIPHKLMYGIRTPRDAQPQCL